MESGAVAGGKWWWGGETTHKIRPRGELCALSTHPTTTDNPHTPHPATTPPLLRKELNHEANVEATPKLRDTTLDTEEVSLDSH